MRSWAALVSSHEALTPPEICRLAQREVPRLSLSTVYRRLKNLQDDRLVLRVDLPGRSTHYEAIVDRSMFQPAAAHHHHLVCNGCERVFPIDAGPERIMQLAPVGFRVEGHDINGRCPACVPGRAAP